MQGDEGTARRFSGSDQGRKIALAHNQIAKRRSRAPDQRKLIMLADDGEVSVPARMADDVNLAQQQRRSNLVGKRQRGNTPLCLPRAANTTK